MPKNVVVLSLGAGVQSTALAIMLEQGALPGLPKPDWALFADTRSEPEHVYDTLEWLRPLVSYPIITTSWGDLRANTWRALRGEPVPERGHHTAGYIDIPVFSETGISRRQCTYVYKIRPIKAAIRELAGSKPPHLTATQYIGISTNEAHRAKPSRDKWITNRFPLIEHGWNRPALQRFLDDNHPGHPVRRSSCSFCPFRSKADWIQIKELYPDLYEDALAMEDAMADHPRGPWFLTPGGLRNAMDKIQQQPTLL